MKSLSSLAALLMAMDRSKKMNRAMKLMTAKGSMMYQPPEMSSSIMETSRVTTSPEAAMASAPEPVSCTVVPPRVRSWMRIRTKEGMCVAIMLWAWSPTPKVADSVCHTANDGGVFPPAPCSHCTAQPAMPNMSQ